MCEVQQRSHALHRTGTPLGSPNVSPKTPTVLRRVAFLGVGGKCLLAYQGNTFLAKRLNFELFGITCLVGKIKFKLLFQGPLAK